MIETEGGEEGPENEEEQVNDNDIQYDSDDLPVWRKNKRLSSYEGEDTRTKMYKKSMKKLNIKWLMCERQIWQPDYEKFGVVGCVLKLGWGQHLENLGEKSEEIYVDAILEWMSTMKKNPGLNPPLTTELVGTVNGKPVIVSFASINREAKFDTGALNGEPYEYPSDERMASRGTNDSYWHDMIHELFVVPPGQDIAKWPLMRENLKVLPKLLLMFLTQNILPRFGDYTRVRLYEVMVLHALVVGKPVLSARHLIMWGLWESREKQDRKSIPHCRLLSKIFKKQKVLPKEARKKKISHPPFMISNLTNTDWKFERNGEIYRLVDVKGHRYMEVGSGIDGVRFGDSRAEDARMRELAEREEQRRQVEIGDRTPYERRLMYAVAEARPVGFTRWSEPEQRMYDRQSQELERTRLYRQYCISSNEYYRNKDFGFWEGVRNYHDEKEGLPYTERPAMPDRSASTYVPYSTSHQMPHFPQFTPSILFPPTPQFQIPQITQSHDGQGSSSSNQADVSFMGDL